MRQTEPTECGLACLAMVLRHHDHYASLIRLRTLFPVAADAGMSMFELARCARQFGFAPRALQGSVEQLKTVTMPAILHWHGHHFVVLVRASARRIRIHDPALGTLDYTLDEARKLFTGFVLELHLSPTFARLSAAAAGRPLTPRQLASTAPTASRLQSASGAFAAIGLLLVLIAPAYVQRIVDDAIKQGNVDHVLLLCMLFGLLYLFDTLAGFLRGWTELALKARHLSAISQLLHSKLLDRSLATQASSRPGHALLLEKAAAAVARFLADGFTEMLVGALSLAVGLAFMAAYSVKLASITLGSLFLLMALRLFLQGRYRLAFDRELSAQTSFESTVVETETGFQTIKAGALEAAAAQRIGRHQSDYLNRAYQRGLITLQLSSGSNVVIQLERVLVIGIGASLVIKGEMPLGMLYAFIQYKLLFAAAAGRMLQRWLDYAALSAPVERIQALLESLGESTHLDRSASLGQRDGRHDGVSDAAAHAWSGEQVFSPSAPSPRPMPAWRALCAERLGFTPPGRHRPLFDGIDLQLQAHSACLIVGGSGSGKTTLLRLLGGLAPPSTGIVTVDREPIQLFSPESVRRRIRMLHVDESFFRGSIAENLCGLTETVDHALLQRACQLACVDQVIDALPDGFDTLINRATSVLSAGQRQRLSLARALYAQPDLLLCDEITANLDDATARQVIANLCSLGIGLVFATHDPRLFSSELPRFILSAGQLKRAADTQMGAT